MRPLLALGLGLALSCGNPVTILAETRAPPDVTHVEQPSAIELDDYVRTWPELQVYASRLTGPEAGNVKVDLQRDVSAANPAGGMLNLLAQIERQEGRLDEAERLIERAIALQPDQHLHHFQQAMIFYARLQQATWGLSRWRWHRRIKDAYRRAFELNPRPVPYRYYLAYTYLQEPTLMGGDKDEGFRLAQEGIEIGLKEFYVVRADAHRSRNETVEAFADYDTAIKLRTFKLNSFLAAGHLALDRKDFERARRYFEWAVNCRPENARTHGGLGDYLAAIGDRPAAVRAYEASLQRDPACADILEKLASLKQAP